MSILGHLLNALIKPTTAALIACLLIGRPDLVDDLRAITWRETRQRHWGPHERDLDTVHGDGYFGQVRLGHLDPACQPYEPDVWATRGAFGLSAASHWYLLPECYPPEILDVAMFSALAAALKYARECEDYRGRRRSWCRVGWARTSNNRNFPARLW